MSSGRRLAAVVLAAGTVLGGVSSQDAAAARAVQVKIVDHYHHGRVQVDVNGVVHRLRYGVVRGPFSVVPDSHHNDAIVVKTLRYQGCGIAKVGYYFHPGHTYKLVVFAGGGQCHYGSDGDTVTGPDVKIVQTS